MKTPRYRVVARKQTLGRLLRVEIKPYPADKKTHLKYNLDFSNARGPRDEIEFSTPVEDGMILLGYLQRLQRVHRFPIPQSVRPTGPAQLRLVEPDDEPQP